MGGVGGGFTQGILYTRMKLSKNTQKIFKKARTKSKSSKKIISARCVVHAYYNY